MLKYLVKTSTTNRDVDNAVEADTVESTSATTASKKKTQIHKFNPAWQKAFSWVKLINNKMFCGVCMNSKYADNSSNFVKLGCANFHIKSLRKHCQSDGHRQFVANAKACSAPPGTNPAERAIQVLHEKEFEKLRVMFRVSHSLAKKGRPYSDYELTLDLHETSHKINLGETYRNDRAGRKFVSFIAEAECLNLASELSAAPFYSVMTDGTTDSSVCEAEIMYVRYCVKGKPSNRFLALRNLPRANAENITSLIESSLKEFGGIPDANLYAKIVGYGADGASGASVNMGSHSGVGQRLREKQPLITVVHCMAHRLELSFKDILKQSKSQLEVVQFLSHIYAFYHKSSLNRSMLKRCSDALGVKGIPTRVGGTRWIPHTYTALQNMWSLYPALLQHFGEVSNSNKVVDHFHALVFQYFIIFL